MNNVHPFNKLVKLAGRAFYDYLSTELDRKSKTKRGDNRGAVVVVLDALTRRQWVREEDLVNDLKIPRRALRRILKLFEEEKMVMRCERKEKTVRMQAAAAPETANGQRDEKTKLLIQTYCCLDYAQIYDVVRYRIHHMKKELKDALDTRDIIQKYKCPNCGKRYDAKDASYICNEDGDFHCESCDGELVEDSDMLAVQISRDGDDNGRRCRREKLEERLQKIEEQLQPLVQEINRLKDLQVPEYGTLREWEARTSAAARGEACQYYLNGTNVEVVISGGIQDEAESNPDTPMKTMPHWMIKQGMNLPKDEDKVNQVSAAFEMVDDKKSSAETEEKIYQHEYIKAYYEALMKRQWQEEASQQLQQQQQQLSSGHTSDRQVGMKSKRETVSEEDDEWEEVAPSGKAEVTVSDVQAEVPTEDYDDGDDIEWEEGREHQSNSMLNC